MKGKKFLSNKGFSLVELIIVIAIMGILVGVVGTQVVPYMERSREAKDKQILSSVATAVTSAIAMEGVSTIPIISWSLEGLAAYDTYATTNYAGYNGGTVYTEMEKLLAEFLLPEGTANKTGAEAQKYLENQFTSKKAKENPKIYISYFPNEGKLYVFLSKEGDSEGISNMAKNGIWHADDEIDSKIVLYVESN